MNERVARPWFLPITTVVLGALVLAGCTASAATKTRAPSVAPSAAAKTTAAAATSSMPMNMSMPPASSAAAAPATEAASVAPAATTAVQTPAPATTPAPAATVATAAPVATPVPTVQTASGPISVTLVDVAIRLDRSTTSAGAVTFSIKNAGTVVHELIVLRTDIAQDQIPTDPTKPGSVTQPGFIAQSATLQPGGTTTLSLTLASGKYVLMCNQPAHYLVGMHTGFTVN